MGPRPLRGSRREQFMVWDAVVEKAGKECKGKQALRRCPDPSCIKGKM